MRPVRSLHFALSLGLITAAPLQAESAQDYAFVQGVWNAQVQFQTEAGEWGEPVVEQATGQTILGGTLYELDFVVPFPGASFLMRMTLGYDKFNKLHRMAVFDDINGYIDLYNGRRLEDGTIVLDNMRTTTAFPDGKGGMVYGRIRLEPDSDGWVFYGDVAQAEGGEWKPYLKASFTPRS